MRRQKKTKWTGTHTTNGTVHRNKIMHQHVQFIFHFQCVCANVYFFGFWKIICWFIFMEHTHAHTLTRTRVCNQYIIMICNYYYSTDVFDRFFFHSSIQTILIVVALVGMGISYMLVLISNLFSHSSFCLPLSLSLFFYVLAIRSEKKTIKTKIFQHSIGNTITLTITKTKTQKKN